MIPRFYNVAAQVQFIAQTGAGAVASTILVDNRNGLGLRMDWKITKTNTPEPDMAEVTIFNLARASREILAAAVPPFVDRITTTISIGWDGLPEVVFIGSAWRVDPQIKDRPNVLTMVQAGDGLPQTRDSAPAGGVEAGIGVQLAVAKILGQMDLTPSADALTRIGAAAAQVPLQTFQLVYGDDQREMLDALMATVGLQWGISDGRFVVFDAGLRNDVLPLVLSAPGGLMQANLTNDGGVAFLALANPRAVPGGQVTVLTTDGGDLGGGPLRIERVEFVGTTRGRSVMSGIARKVLIS